MIDLSYITGQRGDTRRGAITKLFLGFGGLVMPGLMKAAGTEQKPAAAESEFNLALKTPPSGKISREKFETLAAIKVPGFKVVEAFYAPENEQTIVLVGENHSEAAKTVDALKAIRQIFQFDLVGMEGFYLNPENPRNFENWKAIVETFYAGTPNAANLLPKLQARDLNALGQAEKKGVALNTAGFRAIGVESKDTKQILISHYGFFIGKFILTPCTRGLAQCETLRKKHALLNTNIPAFDKMSESSSALQKLDATAPVFDGLKVKELLAAQLPSSTQAAVKIIFDYSEQFDVWSASSNFPKRNSESAALILKVMAANEIKNAAMTFGNSHFSKGAALFGKTLIDLLKAQKINIIYLQPNTAYIDAVENRWEELAKKYKPK